MGDENGDGGADDVLAVIQEESLGEFRIGREVEANELFLNDKGVSRRHARIFAEEGRLLVEDLGSSGGTYLNGRELRRPHALSDGAELRMGRVRIAVEIEGEAPPDEAAGGGEDGWDGDAPAIEEPADGNATVAIGGKGDAGRAPALPRDFSIELGDDVVVIGRGQECQVVLDSPVISREHAQIKPARSGGWSVRDLGSKNGTFVNGEPAERPRKLVAGDTVSIGPYRLKFDGARLTRQELKAGARIEVAGLYKRVEDRETRKPKNLLEDVTLVIQPGEFVGLMGPVGCGKSTFMGMINGRELADPGLVFYDGEDLFSNLDALKAGISYIPQQVDPSQVIVHQDLPVAEALRYTSRLRLPADTSEQELEANIDRVLKTVRLDHRRDVQIKHLSGGQRKKVAVAMELLSRPRVLLADEVTAGMDLGNEQQTMELFRKLADEGMTVVTITHYVDRLKMCDKVACFAGGRVVFYGPPEEIKQYFEVEDMGDVYGAVDAQSPGALAASFERSDAYADHVSSHVSPPEDRRTGQTRRPPTFTGEDRMRQWKVLTDRYVRLMGLDPSGVGVLMLVAPVVAFLLSVLAWSVDAPSKPADTIGWTKVATQQNLLCFGSVVTVLFLGLFGAVREVVKELPVYRHERFVNLLIAPYVMSKAVPLAVLAAVQAVLVGWIVLEWGGLDVSSVPRALLVLWLTGVCGTMLGLLISSAVRTSDQAVMVMIAVVIPQILFAGAVVPVKGASAFIAKVFIPAYWAHDALKALLDTTTQRFIDATAPSGGASWLRSTIMLPLHAVVYGVLAFLCLARKDGPGGVSKAVGAMKKTVGVGG
jgi:ABC-type multidrug transport system ATPase subunit